LAAFVFGHHRLDGYLLLPSGPETGPRPTDISSTSKVFHHGEIASFKLKRGAAIGRLSYRLQKNKFF